MSYTITHRDGWMEVDPAGDWLSPLVAELGAPDDEHPDVAVSHETGWTLSVFASGLVLWENVDEPTSEKRHATLPTTELLRALGALSRGELDAVRGIIEARDIRDR